MESDKKRKSSGGKKFKWTPTILKHIKIIFTRTPIVSSAKQLQERCSPLFDSEIKISFNTFKQKLTQSGILNYSRKKPVGYTINKLVWNSYAEKAGLEEKFIIDDTEINKEKETSIQEKDSKREKSKDEQGKEEKSKEELKGMKSNRKPQEINKNNDIDKEKEKNEEKEIKIQNKEKSIKKNNQSNQSMEDILDRIPAFPSYLLSRMQPLAQRALRTGILELNRMSTSALEKQLDALNSARMFYDDEYENEKELLEFLDKKVSYMSQLLQEKNEKEGIIKFNKIVTEPLRNGKFKKLIDKWGNEWNVEELSWQILKKIGRKAKKIPWSEYILRKKIKETLLKMYPDRE